LDFVPLRIGKMSKKENTMKRKLILAIALVAFPAAGLSSFAAQAQSMPAACSAPNSNRTTDPINSDPEHIIASLRAKGVKVSRIESFGGCIRAYVTDANGAEAMAYYNPDTLEPLDAAGAGVGAGAAGQGQAGAAAGASTSLGGNNNNNTNNANTTNGGDSTMGAPNTGPNAAGGNQTTNGAGAAGGQTQ
jgi:hypothetical protein